MSPVTCGGLVVATMVGKVCGMLKSINAFSMDA